MAGEQLGKLLHGKGKVVLFRYIEVCASTGQREAGFLAAIKKFPEIQVIVDNRYSGTTISEAQSAALNMLDKLREADGIFCSNEPSTFGTLLALKQNNLAGSKKFVGFDTSPALVEGLKRGEIQALLVQSKDIQWSWVHHGCIEGTRLLFESVNSVSNRPLRFSSALVLRAGV
jgi:ribose transport system substrate-binding protein